MTVTCVTEHRRRHCSAVVRCRIAAAGHWLSTVTTASRYWVYRLSAIQRRSLENILQLRSPLFPVSLHPLMLERSTSAQSLRLQFVHGLPLNGRAHISWSVTVFTLCYFYLVFSVPFHSFVSYTSMLYLYILHIYYSSILPLKLQVLLIKFAQCSLYFISGWLMWREIMTVMTLYTRILYNIPLNRIWLKIQVLTIPTELDAIKISYKTLVLERVSLYKVRNM